MIPTVVKATRREDPQRHGWWVFVLTPCGTGYCRGAQTVKFVPDSRR